MGVRKRRWRNDDGIEVRNTYFETLVGCKSREEKIRDHVRIENGNKTRFWKGIQSEIERLEVDRMAFLSVSSPNLSLI